MFRSHFVSFLAATVAATSPYAPSTTTCPDLSSSLIRDGNTALGPGEAAYIAGRKAKAEDALSAWLEAQAPGLGSSNRNSSSMPTLALSVSGGGWRALLTGAGAMRAMDARETDAPASTAGLLQALTYHIGVSGGAWLVGSWAGANFPTVTELGEDLWLSAFDHGLELPRGWKFLEAYADIAGDLVGKSEAGFPVNLVDAWSRLLAYQFVEGDNGGVATRLSDVAGYSNMTDFSVPMPIINSNGVNAASGQCDPLDNNTVWEYNPFEFGSWDDDVAAWIPIEYLGTAASANTTDCVSGFDNLGFVLGVSSNLFAMEACVENNPFSGATGVLQKIVEDLHVISTEVDFGRVPNPFKGLRSSGEETSEVFAVDELYMVDGGIGLHNDPVAPLLEPARDVDVIFLSDSSADEDNLPTGQCLIDSQEYIANISRIADRLPTIPSIDTFLAQGLNKRAVFFGCDEMEAVTIVWLPNVNTTYQSNLDTSKFQYDKDVTEGMIDNGAAVATQDGDEGWGLCLACAIMMKQEGVVLPDGCDACFEQWCYQEPREAEQPGTTSNSSIPSTGNMTAALVRRSSVKP